MPEFLETRVDKFTFKVALDRFYNAEGVWAKPEGDRIRIGLSDFIQQRSGNVAFAEVKPVGTRLAFGEEMAVIETIKVNISLGSPVSGEIAEINPAMASSVRDDQPGPLWGGLAGSDGSRRLGSGQLPAIGRSCLLRADEGTGGRGDKVMMTPIRPKVVIVPCSGIGKTYGSVSREAAYEVVENLRPDDTQLVALSLLVMGDDTSRAEVTTTPAVTIDGCKLACATKMVQECGGRVAQRLRRFGRLPALQAV